MNIKNIKALGEKEVYPKWFLERHTGGTPHIIEDLPEGQRDRCMPYKSFPIPSIEQLCVMITDYSMIDIHAEWTDLGWVGYIVKIKYTEQDTVEKEFFSPFLDDALAEALMFLKEKSDEKKEGLENQDNQAK